MKKQKTKPTNKRISRRIQVTFWSDTWDRIDAKLSLVERKLNQVVRDVLKDGRF